MSGQLRFTFPATLRVKSKADFDRAYQLRRRRDVGCLVVYAAPNGGRLTRLGLSVSRKVGNAAVRNTCKRLLREAFRMEQHALPAGTDLVIVVRPHDARSLDDYRALLRRATTGS
jgi:ribonuclease P protein component